MYNLKPGRGYHIAVPLKDIRLLCVSPDLEDWKLKDTKFGKYYDWRVGGSSQRRSLNTNSRLT